MSLEGKVTELAEAIGADVRALRADKVDATGGTIEAVTIVSYIETVASSSTVLSITDGTIMPYTMNANTTFTDGLNDGENLTLHLNGGDTYTPIWPTIKWQNGSVPTNLSGTDDVFQFWKVSGSLYGIKAGGFS